jgi:hypothetical protein
MKMKKKKETYKCREEKFVIKKAWERNLCAEECELKRRKKIQPRKRWKVFDVGQKGELLQRKN